MKIRPKILPNLDFGKSELRCFTPCHMSIMSRTVKHEVVISQTLTQRILGPLNTKALEISVSIHQRMVAGGSKKSNLCNSLRHSFSHMMEQHRMTCMSWHFWRAGPHKRNKFVRMQNMAFNKHLDLVGHDGCDTRSNRQRRRNVWPPWRTSRAFRLSLYSGRTFVSIVRYDRSPSSLDNCSSQ